MRVLKPVCIFASVLLTALPAVLADSRFDDVEYEVTDLGHGIYRLEAAGGNIGLSIGEDGAFLIDDQYAPLSEKLLAAIRELTDEPVHFVINTHLHGDHTGGNAALAAQGAFIVAHENVRARMAQPGKNQAAEEALPVVTFSDRNTYHLNGHTIRVFHVARAHTDGDAMVQFPEANIIHAGDILFNGIYPYIDLDSGGSVDGYIDAMESLAGMADSETQIIAGHGPLATKADVDKSLSMLKIAKARMAALVLEGMSLEEVQESEPFADFHEDWAWRFITAERFTEILFNDATR